MWAVGLLDVRPDDVILEIGCGYGHSIPLICEKLDTGHLTAIDRSEKMTAAARKANAAYLESGRVSLLHQDLLDRALPAGHFDKIFLYNINTFWMDPAAELREIKRLLGRGGKFYLFHQPPPGLEVDEYIEAFAANLDRFGFRRERTVIDKTPEIRSLCIVSSCG